jgi:hypothetical protein
MVFTLTNGKIALVLSPSKRVKPRNTQKYVYLFSLDSGNPAANLTPHNHGAISSLHLSPDGSQLVSLEMAEDGYEAAAMR